MFFTYICYWNTFHYKYIIQAAVHAVKESHAPVILKEICLLFIIFLCLFPCFLDFILFPEGYLHCLIDLAYSYI